jgi:hypothetical protein
MTDPESSRRRPVQLKPLKKHLLGIRDLRTAIAPVRTARIWVMVIALVTGVWGGRVRGQSYFPQRPDDPRAVDFERGAFGARADGAGDDAEALQQAINRVQETTRAGVVLIRDGRYRLGKTVYVWPGIRLIGYGPKRPVLVLGRDTPGFQEGAGRYMVHFADNRPQGAGPIVDASEFTFFSGMNNVDFEMQEGNAAAIAIRFHVAQHGVLTHMDFRVGTARAALEDIGNQASDIHVHGGEYGIITRRTAPVWQFLLMDSSFDGQRAAAIRTMEAGFTLIRDRFANMPVGLEIEPGEVEQLYGRDLEMEDIREAAFVPGNWRNAHSAVTLTNIACSNVPHFCSGEQTVSAPSRNYVVEHFSLGLEIGADGREEGIRLRHQERRLSKPAPAVASDIPTLPPMEEWVNVRALGVKGESSADDTAALQAAIDQHPVLFFPSGTNHVSGPLTLRPDSVLIGLNPGTTQIRLNAGAAAFAGAGDAVGVISAPGGGSNIVSSISISSGVRNPRAADVIWRAGAASMLDDVSFAQGGGAGFGGDGGRGRRGPGTNDAMVAAGVTNAATPAPRGRGPGPGQNFSGTQAGELIVRDGGGGIFRGCWAHDTNGKAGLRVENTASPGRIYQMSVEHHMRIETQFDNAHNWEIYALQTEEENPAGAEANALEVQDSSALLFANTFMYRVSRNVQPKTHAAIVRHSDRIAFQNAKVFSQTRLAFDNAVLEEDSGVTVRPHFFTSFVATQGAKAPAPVHPPKVFAKGARLERLATGFSNVAGLAASETGGVFFTDAANGKVFRWEQASKKAALLAEISGQPQVLGSVPPSDLLVIGNARAVYHVKIGEPEPDGTTNTVRAEAVKESADLGAGTALLLPVGLHNPLSVMKDLVAHRGYVFRLGSNTAIVTNVPDEHRGYYYAPGTMTAIMAGGTWRPYLQSSQLAAFAPGDSHYVTSEDDGRTYIARLEDYRDLSATVFAERGGTSVVTDAAGNVYIASGEVWIYDRKGKAIGFLEVPERPGSLAFGGPAKNTLYIGARSSLYSIQTRVPGSEVPAQPQLRRKQGWQR